MFYKDCLQALRAAGFDIRGQGSDYSKIASLQAAKMQALENGERLSASFFTFWTPNKRRDAGKRRWVHPPLAICYR